MPPSTPPLTPFVDSTAPTNNAVDALPHSLSPPLLQLLQHPSFLS